MNTYYRIIQGLNIFSKYLPENDRDACAEHDILHAGPNPDVVSPEDLQRLEELGWHQSEQFDSFYLYT